VRGCSGAGADSDDDSFGEYVRTGYGLDMAPVRVFIDTNVFLQLRDLKDLTWREVFKKADEIEVYVVPVVIDELDQKKTSQKRRLRDRARAALELIDRASDADDHRLVLRPRAPRVMLCLARAPRPRWDDLPLLDPSRPDDQLVAAAVAEFSGAFLPSIRLQNENVALLTCDRGPRIRAKHMKLPAHTPPKGWYLPDEADERDREIADLKRQLDVARATRPAIAAWIGADADRDGPMVVVVPSLPPLKEPVARDLTGRWLRRNREAEFPPPAAWPSAALDIHRYVSPEEVQRYQRAYSAFASAVKDYFAQLHELVAQRASTACIPCFIRNVGSVTAERIIVELEGSEQLSYYDRESEARMRGGSLALPRPPEAPLSIMDRVLESDHVRSLKDLLAKPTKDPTSFYRRAAGERPLRAASWECEEFRPTREFECRAWFRAPEQLPAEVFFRLEISARNMISPVDVERRIRIELMPMDWSDPRAREGLPDWISDTLVGKTRLDI
jgi:hypothetical protein